MPSANQIVSELAGTYCGPQDFARIMCALGESDTDPSKLADETIHLLCTLAFAASMKTEEGGECRARFVRPSHDVLAVAEQSMVRFEHPIPLQRPSDITKMAVIASDPMALMLDQNGTVPLVTGLLDHRWLTPGAIGGPWVEFEPLPGLHLEILRPGVLKCGPYLLSDGRVDRLWHGPDKISGFLKISWRWQEFSIAHTVSPNEYCAEKDGNALLRMIWARMWPELLSTLRLRGHGATLVLTPDTQWGQGNARPIRNFHFGLYVKRFAEIVHENHLLQEGKRDQMRLIWECAKRDLLNAIKTLSDLTQLDGAVILSDALEVVAIGARLIPGTEKLPYRQVDLVESLEQPDEFCRSHGTRHNSAIDFCATTPNSTAIIISQDGELSVVASTDSYWTLIIPRLA